MLGGCHVKPEQFFNLIFGYYDQYAEYDSDLAAPAGLVTKSGSAVPADEVWVITHIWSLNASRGAVQLILIANVEGDQHPLIRTSPAAGLGQYWGGRLVLKEGDYLQWQFLSTVSGDDLYWGALGYKMKLSQ